ncbi:MAG: hypothetical protein H6Q00_3539 [Holophagaceae bacterium]|nr:hypothetical protein [Holophagaceae bacterium]
MLWSFWFNRGLQRRLGGQSLWSDCKDLGSSRPHSAIQSGELSAVAVVELSSPLSLRRREDYRFPMSRRLSERITS